ncbi:hypothetical protein [Effusibacillus lacus]|uniref:hypothetical protein n=1 Tax=Effusibacillus lacus TaxID=1348429 RepID=UPI000BB6AD25
MHAGLESSSCSWNLVVACDMPMVTAEAGRFLLDQLHVRRVTESDFPDEVDTKRVFCN